MASCGFDNGLEGNTEEGDLYSHAELLSCGDFPYRTKGALGISHATGSTKSTLVGRAANGLSGAGDATASGGGCCRRCKRCDGGAESKLAILRYRMWRLLRTFVFLLVLGSVTSMLAWCLDFAAKHIQTKRVQLIDQWYVWAATDIAPGASNSTLGPRLDSLLADASGDSEDDAVPILLIVMQCALFITVSIALALAALALIAFVETSASGSGIPQMKAVLNGDPIFAGFTTMRCLFTKLLGLMCSWTSGLSVGKEGPFVHIACCISALMMRIPAFSFYAHSAPHRIGMLGISSAVGVAAVFGSPLGGVLFAIEVVSTFFRVSNLPRMFVSAVVGSLVVKTFGFYEGWPLALFSTNFEVHNVGSPLATMAFLVLGIIQGVLAGCFIIVVKYVVRFQNRNINTWCRTPKLPGGGAWWCCSGDEKTRGGSGGSARAEGGGSNEGAVASSRRPNQSLADLAAAGSGGALGTFGAGSNAVGKQRCCRGCRARGSTRLRFFARHAAVLIPVVLLECALSLSLHRTVPAAAKQKDLITLLFDEKEVSQIKLPTILVLFCAKFVLTALCCSLPLPSGLFTPVFTVGALSGRLFGQGVTALSSYYGTTLTFSAGEFAVAGAAAFAGGVTRSIATAAIVMELTGQLHLQIPVAVCVLASYFVSNRFAPAVYDVLVKEHRLPHLPKLPFTAVEVSVADAMVAATPSLCATRTMTVSQLRLLVAETGAAAQTTVPVVAGEKSGSAIASPMQLDGEMHRRHLVEALEEIDATVLALAQRDEHYSSTSSSSSSSSSRSAPLIAGGSAAYGSTVRDSADAPMVLLRRPSFSLVVEGCVDESREAIEKAATVQISFEDESARHRLAAARVLNSSSSVPLIEGTPRDSILRLDTAAAAAAALSSEESGGGNAADTGGVGLCFKLMVGTGAPMQLVMRTSLVQAELLFRMLRMRRCYVVNPGGVLVGTLTRADFVRVTDALKMAKRKKER